MRGTPMEKGGRSGIIGRAFVTTLIWNSIRTRVGGREGEGSDGDGQREITNTDEREAKGGGKQTTDRSD